MADTACVLALTGANGRFRVCTTVEMSVRFIRPLLGPADIRADIESNGRKLAVCRVAMRPADSHEKRRHWRPRRSCVWRINESVNYRQWSRQIFAADLANPKPRLNKTSAC